MNLRMTVCDECILEEILEDHPSYTLEAWGDMPVWYEYREKSKPKLCVVAGDIEMESVCLKHLFSKDIE